MGRAISPTVHENGATTTFATLRKFATIPPDM